MSIAEARIDDVPTEMIDLYNKDDEIILVPMRKNLWERLVIILNNYDEADNCSLLFSGRLIREKIQKSLEGKEGLSREEMDFMKIMSEHYFATQIERYPLCGEIAEEANLCIGIKEKLKGWIE